MKDNRKVLYDIVYEKMFTVMNNYHPVSESLRELIYDNSAPVRFTKGELLLTENRECNVLFFIAGGFCSCFYNKDGKECIIRFAGDGNFCTSWHSFLGKQRSLINIKATEDTTAVCFKREQFDKLWEESTEFVAVICRVLEMYAIESEEKTFRMRSNQAEGRVRHCMDTREIHYLMKHVPRYNIASYLNMTQETFSKIFTQLNREQK